MFLDWITAFDDRFVIPLSVIIYLSEADYNPQMVRDVSKTKYNHEMAYADAHNALTTVREIKRYNDSQFRRTQPIKLPEPCPPQKIVPDNKVMIVKAGRSLVYHLSLCVAVRVKTLFCAVI